MNLSRREFLRLAGLVAASGALAGCQPAYQMLGGPVETLGQIPQIPPGDFIALSRMTFGPRLSERERVLQTGLAGWIEEQLAPDSISDSPLDWRLRPFDLLDFDSGTLADMGDKLFDDIYPDAVTVPFKQATLLRKVYSQRQLYEMMVSFWTDHFNITVEKSDCWFLKVVDDREVIRRHALGNFRDLLHASAKSPAMLVYLDNQANYKDAPNENYAREVMELHTLGVDGGYTQQDVMELARCLTGWSVKETFTRGEFEFNEEIHDPESKTVLGKTIRPAGIREAEEVLDMLAGHPATANFIARKLVTRFVADDPPEALVRQAAETFLETDGDIKSVLRTVLLDGLLPQKDRLPAKYKRPVDFVVSSLRMLNAETDGGEPLDEYLSWMGQPPFKWPTPDGPPVRAEEWQGSLLPRWKFALSLARNEIPGTEIDVETIARATGTDTIESFIEAASPLALGVQLDPSITSQLAATLRNAGAADNRESGQVILAGLLASPAFQWK